MSVMDDSVRQSGKSLRWTSGVLMIINKIISVGGEKKYFSISSRHILALVVMAATAADCFHSTQCL